MKILFVATRKNSNPEDREFYEMHFMLELLGFQRSLLDLGLVTVAACTPKDVEVEIIDEYFDEIPYHSDADLVALSAKTSCVTHVYEVAAEFRKRGTPVVLGGIHATLRPEEALEHVDYIVLGEAEETWPRFVKLFQENKAPRTMPSAGFPAMEHIPVPAWNALKNEKYFFHQIQTTRGCPFMCRFCSVPDISGNAFRFKPVEEIIAEIRALPKSSTLKNKIKPLYFVDDNFISKTKYTKDLLTALKEMYQKGELCEWSAETTLNVAKDEELLDLFADSGCSTLIIGFESISEATLLDMNKKVNFCLSYQESIERIHQRGMSIVGNFIVGFDTDTISVFQDIMDFVDENNILYPFFSILTPMPGTQLHDDFKADGRLDHFQWDLYDTRHVVFEPKHMTREQLQDGYIWLYEEAFMSQKALDRLERFWRKYKQKPSGFLENTFVRIKLQKFMNQGSPRFQRFLRDGWKRLSAKNANADVGQLIYYYDAAHFLEYLSQFRSENYQQNVRKFRGEIETNSVDNELERKQWERVKRNRQIRESALRS